MIKATDLKESSGIISQSLCNVGQRIKAIRKNRKMTQSELACGEITRNMLSRIENGCALPSLPTLVHIADKLKIPVSALLDDSSFNDNLRSEAVKTAQKYMKEGNFKAAIEAASSLDSIHDDELSLIIIECELNIAKKYICERKYFDAYQSLTNAVGKTQNTIYSTAGSGYIADLYHSLLFRMLPVNTEDKPPTPPQFNSYINLYIYLRIMDLFDTGQIVKAINLAALCEIDDRILSAHIAAKLDMANGNYTQAMEKLKQITNCENEAPTPHGSIILYRVYDELEQCAKGINDYVLAYTYKEEKLKLYSLMSGIKL